MNNVKKKILKEKVKLISLLLEENHKKEIDLLNELAELKQQLKGKNVKENNEQLVGRNVKENDEQFECGSVEKNH